jgi:hypothetical protein
MTLPYTSKFYSNGAIFDSFGDLNQKYISYYIEGDMLYYLFEQNNCLGINLKTEEIISVRILPPQDLVSDEEPIDINCKTIVSKNGNVYGFDGYHAKIFRDEYVLYKRGNAEIWRESLDHSSKDLLLSSTSEIRDFIIDDDDNFYVLHTKSKITKFNKYREKIYTLTNEESSLSGIIPNASFIKLDIVREYNESGINFYPIILGNNTDERHFLAKLNESSLTFENVKLIDSYGIYENESSNKRLNYNLTNYDYLKHNFKNKKSIIFKTRLKNIYNNRNILDLEIPVDISSFKNGEHHFIFRLNTIKGKIDIFVDGSLYESIDFPKADFSFQDITQESFVVGTTYFHNNITLPQYLKQPKNYMLNNCSIKNFKLFDKAISNDEIKFLLIENYGASDLVASLPAGHRNEIEQIERTFSVNTPGNKSNKINIIIKNSNINNDIIKQNVKNIILEKINKILPVGVTVNDVVFKNTNIK